MAFWKRFLFSGSGENRIDGLQQPKPPQQSEISSKVSFDSAMSVSAFWASARLLSEAVAAMPIYCYRKETDQISQRDDNYELWRTINYRPNKRQTRTEFIESIMLALVTWGNAYIAVERTSRGRVVSLTPLMPAQMEVDLMDGAIIYTYTDGKGNVKVFSESSMWHIRLFGNGIVGLSPLGYARQSLGIAIEADRRVGKLAASGGKATGILTVDDALTDQQRARVRENFQGLEEGSTAGLFVLEAGFKYQQTSLSPSDMQMIENRRFQVEDIARFMGVPSVLINDTSATTTWGSGIEQITQGFYKLNLRPYLERIESSIKRHLMPESDWSSIDIQFDFDALLRADKSTRLDAQAKAVNAGLLTPNEGRAMEGLPPKRGGNEIYLNGTLVPAGMRPNEMGLNDGTQATGTE